MKILLIISAIIVGIGIAVLIDAGLAWLIWLALNAWTQLHPTYLTVFVIVIIIAILTGGMRTSTSSK
jgi:hypothetical protein